MPEFGQQDGFNTVAYITGPCHVLLGIRFGDTQAASFQLRRCPCGGACHHGALNETRIVESIEAGVAAANAETGARLSVAEAFYIENDSPRYDLFRHCAYLLAIRQHRHAE